jgi:predicted metal-dependent hydrolase
MSQSHQHTQRPIQPRERLDFKLGRDMPRFWMGGDVFKTRLFDAMSTTFPIGERYFITSVRAYRDQITDPKLQAEVRDFIRQEGQHGMVHASFNNMLKEQGVDVDHISNEQQRILDRWTKRLPKVYNLALTAAFEHLTAMMCSTFIERTDLMQDFEPRMRALYAWHSIEEVEHKAVCYDVLKKVAGASYFTRVLAMLHVSVFFPVAILRILNIMFKADGIGWGQRVGLWARGLWWLYKPGGVFMPALGFYLSYYKPGFHPWQHPEMKSYGVWAQAFERTGDPIQAANALHLAMIAR